MFFRMRALGHLLGRILDLARYLSRHGRMEESDALFLEAGKLRPNEPRVVFARAETYVETRHWEEARKLLRQYLASDRTPEDPPQQAAEKLLHQIQGD